MGRSIWRPAYDPAAEYVVSHKGLLFGGRSFTAGEKFDVKTTDRQRRILYESRFLDMVSTDQPEVKPPPPPIKSVTLSGTSLYGDHVDVNGVPISTEQFVQSAFCTSGMSIEQWNATEQDERDQLITAAVELARDIAFDELEAASMGEQYSEPETDDTRPETPPDAPQSPQQVKRGNVIAAGRGWYDVVDDDGNQVNDKRLRLDDAVALAEGRA